jgi:hypothetical protein
LNQQRSHINQAELQAHHRQVLIVLAVDRQLFPLAIERQLLAMLQCERLLSLGIEQTKLIKVDGQRKFLAQRHISIAILKHDHQRCIFAYA